MGASDADSARLREVLAGEVLEPGTPGYEPARKPAMPRFWDIRPRAVVRAASGPNPCPACADAVHLASALAVADPDLIVAVWDRRLHAGAVTAGLRLAPASLATGAGHGG